ncbi:response regulator [Halorientalis salina]|uniref:response regulator n=1 Tax=Halorientalis salina TaxID=2932266 RepID=UPI0010ABE0B8|nr:response regulator [Halorientalis salina]
MSQRSPARPTVLIADDERPLADLYTDYLAEDYEVLTAYGGEEALEYLDEAAARIDVALLDRRMPDVSGDKVLARINDSDEDCRVAMVTAVNPGFDLIDMGCDEYLIKPVSRDDLLDVVERLLKLSEYSDKHQQLTSKRLTRNVLEVEKSGAELAESERFARLESEIEQLETRLDDITEDLEFEDLQRHI